MPEIRVDVNIDLVCGTCGEELEGNEYAKKHEPIMQVEPCEVCLQEQFDLGKEEAESEAK